MSGLSKVSGSKVCGKIRRLNSPGQTVVAGLRSATSTRIRALSATPSAATWALSFFLPLQRREQIPPPSSLEGRGKQQIRQRSGCSRAMASPAKTQLCFCSRATLLLRAANQKRKDSVAVLFPPSASVKCRAPMPSSPATKIPEILRSQTSRTSQMGVRLPSAPCAFFMQRPCGCHPKSMRPPPTGHQSPPEAGAPTIQSACDPDPK